MRRNVDRQWNSCDEMVYVAVALIWVGCIYLFANINDIYIGIVNNDDNNNND